eukprot:CFRG5204T1
MNMLSDYWNSIPAPVEHSGADTVAKLCDRVASSTLLEDRRDAVRALKAMAQDYQLEIGTQGMDVLMLVLQNDRSDVEIVRYALETLACVFHSLDHTKTSIKNDKARSTEDLTSDLGVGFTEIFVKKKEYVSNLLSLLEEYDFYVRFHCVQVLLLLLTNCPDKLQECVLADPRGVSRLMDLLDESREILRNEALLLLIQLTMSNPNVQKIVVFENAFDRLLDIIRDEGYSDGGIVVQDCLHLIHNLLRKNISNQNYFRETGNLSRVNPFLELKGAPAGLVIPGAEEEKKETENDWPEQKITNMLMMVELVRILVTPTNPNTSTNQKAMLKQTTCETLYNLTLQDVKLPSRVQVQVRCAVGEAMRGCPAAQQLFSGTTGRDGSRPRPALVTLVVDLLAFRNPFDYRCASLYCLESFLYENIEGQVFLTSTLNQPPNANLAQATDTPLAAGAQILSALSDTTDGISHWCACLALSSAVRGNPKAKEMVLSFHVNSGGVGGDGSSNHLTLLNLCLKAFNCNGMQKTRVSVSQYVFLCSFLNETPTAITAYLSEKENLSNLITHCQEVPRATGGGSSMLIPGLASLLLGICLQWTKAGSEADSNPHASRQSLLQVIHHIIGVDKFSENINLLMKSNFFDSAQSSHQIRSGKPDETWFDYPFTVLVKNVKDLIMATITMPPQEAAILGSAQTATPVVDNTELKKCREQILAQDRELAMLRQQLSQGFGSLPQHAISSTILTEMEHLRTENAQLHNRVRDLERDLRISQAEAEDLIILMSAEDDYNEVLIQQITDLGVTPYPRANSDENEECEPQPDATNSAPASEPERPHEGLGADGSPVPKSEATPSANVQQHTQAQIQVRKDDDAQSVDQNMSTQEFSTGQSYLYEQDNTNAHSIGLGANIATPHTTSHSQSHYLPPTQSYNYTPTDRASTSDLYSTHVGGGARSAQYFENGGMQQIQYNDHQSGAPDSLR